MMFLSIVFISLIYGIAAQDSGCQCVSVKETCGCCLHLEAPSISLNDTGCVNITYLPDQYGISVTMDIDGHVIINDTISARNPPPLCAAVPYLKNAASVCLDFYDLDVSNHSFSGCVDLEARLYYVLQEKYHLGCWKIGQNFWKFLAPDISSIIMKEWQRVLQIIEAKRLKRTELMKFLEMKGRN